MRSTLPAAYVQSEALALGIKGDILDSVLTFAGREGRISDGLHPGTIVITAAGSRI